MANTKNTTKQKDQDLIDKQPLEKLKLQASALKKISKSFAKKLTVFLFLLNTSIGFSQTVRYVNHSASGTNTGANWTNAYTSLQSAIAVASSNSFSWKGSPTCTDGKLSAASSPKSSEAKVAP